MRHPRTETGSIGACLLDQRLVMWLAISGMWGLAVAPRPAAGYTPESPVVLEMVERGIAFLESTVEQNEEDRQAEQYPDGAALLKAYTHYKVRQDSTHPLVVKGLELAVSDARRAAQNGLSQESKATYEASVALLLMIDVAPQQYATEIQGLGDALMAAQKSHGGFGYLAEELGDTSQTQYVVLAMWTMDQANFKVSQQSMAAAIEYLLRTQDPTGQWGYKGQDSGAIGKFVPQDSHKGHSLTTAGAGSVLIGGDYFSLWRSSREIQRNDVSGLPPAFKEQIDKAEVKEKREGFTIPPATLMQFVTRSENWLNTNPYQRPRGLSWFYYYLYTLERYKSFLEISQGRQDKEPEWYNQVVDVLQSYQAEDGSWGSKAGDASHSSAQISTCFSILFLIRSTKKAIGDLYEGVLGGGYELPKDTTNIRVDGTQIKGEPAATAVTDLLSLLEDEAANTIESGSIPEDLRLAEDPEQRKQQISRLERLARGSQSYQARRVATRLLAQSDQLEVVPTLIFALTDPDKVVKRYARDGLRFISRRFNGFGMPDDPNPQQVDRAVAAWRQWYSELNPGYVFLD